MCAAIVVLGCGGKEGPARYALSGTATLANGQPIPVGELTLEPDAAAGNKGPGSMALIKNGKYSLAAEEGVVGGKYIVTIVAFDGVPFGESTQGKALVTEPYTEKVDLPADDSTRDFKIGGR